MTNKVIIWLKGLKDAKSVLERFNCKYFLDTGTLLGAVRDKQFIPWDSDIDLGVVDSPTKGAFLKKIAKEFYKIGYNVTCINNNINLKIDNSDLELAIKFYDKTDSHYYGHLARVNGSSSAASLYLFLSDDFIYKNGAGKFGIKGSFAHFIHGIRYIAPKFVKEKILWPSMGYEDVVLEIPNHLLGSFDTIEFYDDIFKVPKNPADYLEYRYGKDWRIPNKDYNFTEDDKSIVKKK